MPSPASDPDDLGSLRRRVAELEAQLHPAKTVATAGGAAVNGNVTAGGHFIGRDFIQTIRQVLAPGDDPAQAQAIVGHYLHAQAMALAGLKLGEIDPTLDRSQRSPLQLANVYVALNTTHRLPEGATLANPHPQAQAQRGRRDGPGDGQQQLPLDIRPVTALEALAHHRRLTLLGVAGSGKSTFGAHVLLALTQAWQGQPEALAALGDAWPHGALLPLRIELRRLTQTYAGQQRPLRAGDLWAHLGAEIAQQGIAASADQAVQLLQRLARDKGALWLFDGLDECGPPAQARRVLAGVNELIQNALPNARFLLTARPYAWPQGPDPARGVYLLDALDDEQVPQFIAGWYAALVRRGWGTAQQLEPLRDELLRAWRRPDLRPLARNPLLLTQMAILQSNRGRLPDDRADLYDTTVDLLLERWTRRAGSDQSLQQALGLPDFRLSSLRGAIARLAFEVHAEQTGEASAGERAADIGEDRLNRALRPLLDNDRTRAALAVEFIEQRAGLLVGQGERVGEGLGERQFSFPHRSFQEFLAACHLQSQPDFARQCVRLADQSPLAWGQVLPLAARLAGVDRGASVADELIGGRAVGELGAGKALGLADWHRALLAGLQLQEIGRRELAQSGRTQAIAERVAGWLLAAMPLHPSQGGLPAALRARAGDALAALGDPRFDPERWHLPRGQDLGFVAVPAQDSYELGTADAQRVRRAIGSDPHANELNDTPVQLAAFQVARYPVTVAQYRAFVSDTGHAVADADALLDADSRPVRWVNWHDAQDYCHWLTRQLQHSSAVAGLPAAIGVRQQGWRVDLLSEAEWECAARAGQVGAVFPWGDTPDSEAANFSESGIRYNSAVGCFASNPWGLYDMVGNLWEWTRSVWRGSYRDTDLTDSSQLQGADVPRLVRGGSWLFSRGGARCAVRGGFRPAVRDSFLGFRVVLRSSRDLAPGTGQAPHLAPRRRSGL